MKIYFFYHIQVLLNTLSKMIRMPLTTSSAGLILGIALTLPLLLFQVISSAEKIGVNWQNGLKLSIILTLEGQNIDSRVVALAETLFENPSISDIEYISSIEALVEFKRISGFGDILNSLPKNPLPPMLTIYPKSDLPAPKIERLVENLSTLPEVEKVIYDQIWIQRLSGLILLMQRALLLVSLLMGTGIILIISNTIRLGIFNRKDEIAIFDQIGATHSFIRRPFLYFGVLHGVVGALFALIITNITIFALNRLTRALAELYDTEIKINLVGAGPSFILVGIIAITGWFAARVTTGNYLRRMRTNALGK